MRDALMHGNQVCVPHATLLPAGIERLYPAGRKLDGRTQVRYSAVEREQHGDTYVYDIVVRTDGRSHPNVALSSPIGRHLIAFDAAHRSFNGRATAAKLVASVRTQSASSLAALKSP